jgi:hypothetical protein
MVPLIRTDDKRVTPVLWVQVIHLVPANGWELVRYKSGKKSIHFDEYLGRL